MKLARLLVFSFAATSILQGCTADVAGTDRWRYSTPSPTELGDTGAPGSDADAAEETVCRDRRPETCNGDDDDCDGRIDEGLTASCPRQKGVCRGATRRCRRGTFGPCGPATYGPSYTRREDADDCDGLDNDCDGTVDEACECTPARERPCYPGDPSTRGVGRCDPGTQVCRPNHEWGRCRGATTPAEETCNERDDDCDGVTDEGCSCAYRSLPDGVCEGQTRREDGTCPRPAAYEPTEISRNDGLDNDCDGSTDERERTQVGAGASYSCAITSDRSATCWGWRTKDATNPPSTPLVQISSGQYQSCGITPTERVECWGNGRFIPPGWSGTDFEQVSTYYHTCVLRSSGTVECWGPSSAAKSNDPSGRFRQISAGGTFTCGVETSGQLQCWGYEANGQTDPPSGRYLQVASANTFACAIGMDGTVDCWGGQPDGGTDPPKGTFRDLGAGSSHMCGVTVSGGLECWGRTSYGQTRPPSGEFREVSGGLNHNCARTTGGDIECWGRDDHGESSPPDTLGVP